MKQKTRKLTLPIRLAATVFTTSSLIATSSAADVSWDLFGGGPSDSAITGGTGFWDGSTTNWTGDAGASNVLWNNANNDVAIFGDVAGAVTITGPVTAGGIVFNASGYSISGNVITLGGATTNITVASALTASISSEIAGGVLNVGKRGKVAERVGDHGRASTLSLA